MGNLAREAAGRSASTDERAIEIVLIDDHEVVRSGLKALLESASDMRVVGDAETAQGGIDEVARLQPDVAVVDLRLPDFSGIEACRRMVDANPGVRVLILTSFADRAAVRAAAAAGASGYLLKQVSGFELVADIRRIAEGEGGFIIDEGAMEPDEVECDPETLLARLSPQERVIAGHIARGLTNREIADRMFLAEKTVKNYVSHLLTKMGFSRRSEAAAYVARVEAESERWTGARV